MGKPISYKIDELIIALWYPGHLREYIMKQTGTSAGHISDVVNQEYDLVGQGNVQALRRTAIALGKAGHTLTDLMKAIRFLNACLLQCKLAVDDVVEILPTIVQLCSSHNLKLRELPQKIERDVAELKDLEAKKEALAKEIQQLDARHKQALQNANTTEQDLAKYRSLKERLEKKGLSLDTLDKIENILANAEAANYDVKELADTVSSFRSLTERNSDLESENSSLQTKIKEQGETIHQQGFTLTQNSERLRKLDELDRMGFGLSQLAVLHKLAVNVTNAHGLDASRATEKLLADMERDYEGLVGLQRAIEQLRSQVEQTETRLRGLQNLNASIDQAVRAIIRLHTQGIKEDTIVAISAIIQNSDLTVEELQTAIARYGSFKAATLKLEEQRNKLEKEVQGLKSEVDHLDGEKIARQAALKAINDSLHTEFQTALKQAIASTMSANQKLQNSCANAAKTIDEIGTKARDNVDLFEKYTAIHAFVPLAQAMSGEPVSQSDIRTALILAIQIALRKLGMDALTQSNLREALHLLGVDYSLDL